MTEITRAAKSDSQQPRLSADGSSFGAAYQWLQLEEIQQVPYSANSMQRDAWLRTFWKLEPRLAGIVNAVTLIDSNRGWSLIGGRNQVRRYTDILHAAEGGQGWRTFSRKSSLSYWATDMGAITEVGREGKAGPLRAIYHVDSARCRLTGNINRPLMYYPPSAGPQEWGSDDFFRVCSLPSDDEQYNGLGYCAVSRALELTRLMYAVMLHDQEQVGARMPKGLLLLQNVSQEQWEQAMADRDSQLNAKERRYYGGVAVLAHSGVEQIDAKLVALSQLPANFDAKTFVDMTMYGYALCFGYDPSEFWPVQFGSLGRGTETEVQHQKATGKGGTDFALAMQEQLQNDLPATLQFEFEQRDDGGEIVLASVDAAKIANVTSMYNAGLVQGAPLISREQALSLLAEQGIIPEEWSVVEEDVEATDTEDADEASTGSAEQPEDEPPPEPEPEPTPAERWLETDHVQRAMATWPNEPIIRYQWPTGRVETLWQPRNTPRFHVVKHRSTEGVLYDKNGITITEADVDKAIADGKRRVGAEFAQLLDAPTLTPEQAAKFA